MLGGGPAKRADAYVSKQTELPGIVLGDPTRLRQALINYANNAIKFTERGSITLRSKLLDVTPQDVLLRLEVEDTGIGIAPAVLGRLSRRLSRLIRRLPASTAAPVSAWSSPGNWPC